MFCLNLEQALVHPSAFDPLSLVKVPFPDILYLTRTLPSVDIIVHNTSAGVFDVF